MARLNVEPLEGRALMSANLVPAAGFTPPIGSNKGSLVAGFAGDGLRTDLMSAGTTTAGQETGTTRGIIAILIG